jgi:hypothetical protein
MWRCVDAVIVAAIVIIYVLPADANESGGGRVRWDAGDDRDTVRFGYNSSDSIIDRTDEPGEIVTGEPVPQGLEVESELPGQWQFHGKCHECGSTRPCSHCVDAHQRAGYPQTVAWYAKCTYVPHKNRASFIGGGAALFGEGRCADEGVWGVDYKGCLIPQRVWLQWTHGRRCQGGTGQYQTDGSHVVTSIKKQLGASH